MSLNDAMREATLMNDYRLIKVKQGRSKDVLRPRDTLEAHRRSRVYLESVLTTPFDGDTVLMRVPHVHWSKGSTVVASAIPARPSRARSIAVVHGESTEAA